MPLVKYLYITDLDAAKHLSYIQERMKDLYRANNQEEFDKLAERLMAWIKLLAHNHQSVVIVSQDKDNSVVQMVDGSTINISNTYLRPTRKTRQGF